MLFLLFIQASSTGTERTAMEYLLGNCTCRQIQSANWTAPGHLLSPETLPQTSPVVPLHFYFYFFFGDEAVIDAMMLCSRVNFRPEMMIMAITAYFSATEFGKSSRRSI